MYVCVCVHVGGLPGGIGGWGGGRSAPLLLKAWQMLGSSQPPYPTYLLAHMKGCWSNDTLQKNILGLDNKTTKRVLTRGSCVHILVVLGSQVQNKMDASSDNSDTWQGNVNNRLVPMNQYFHSLKYAAHWFASGVKLAKKPQSAGNQLDGRRFRGRKCCAIGEIWARNTAFTANRYQIAQKGALPPEFLS